MEMFFTRIRKGLQVYRDWQQWRISSRATPEPDQLQRGVGGYGTAAGRRKGPPMFRLLMQVAVSLAVLAVGFYIILSRDEAEMQKWAYGVVGTVVGFWLS